MRIEIPGNPIAKARHRSRICGKKVFTYDPQSKEKDAIKAYLIRDLQERFRSKNKEIVIEASNLSTADVYDVSLVFSLPYPKSRTIGQINRILWGFEMMDEKPDVDNLAKFYLDCANGILFSDDKKVVSLKVKKMYSNNPKTIIEIMPKKNLKINSTAEKIMETLNPKDFSEFMLYINNLYNFAIDYEFEKKEKMCVSDTYLNEMLEESAYFMSLFAEKYALLLSKIRKNFPDYYKNYEKKEKVKKDLSQGKIEKL